MARLFLPILAQALAKSCSNSDGTQLPDPIFTGTRNATEDVDDILARRRRETFESCLWSAGKTDAFTDSWCCCSGKRVDCNEAPIREFPAMSLDVEYVYLDSSGLREIRVDSTDSADLSSRTIELWMRNNKLTELDFGHLRAIPTLRLLVLQNNKINQTINTEHAPESTKPAHPSLEVLELPGNRFKSISNGTFPPLPALRNLSLASNQIEYLSEFAFAKCGNLSELILRGNYLKSENIGGFANLNNLVKLDLSHNLIQIIRSAVFSNLEKLEILKLNGNKLTYISPVAFNRLKSLKHIDLTENWLTTVDPAIFDPIPMSNIDVTTNPFVCNCGIQSFVTWARLNTERLINGDKIQCMYGGESEQIRKNFSKLLYSLGGVQLCSVISDLKVAIVIPCVIFGVVLLVVCITCVKRKIFSETKEMEEYNRNEMTRQAVEEVGSINEDDAVGIPVSLMPQQHIHPDLMANRPEVMGAVRQQQLESMGIDPLHARIAASRGARNMSATGYSSSAYGSEDEKPHRIRRPDLNARRRSSDSDEEGPTYQNFRGQGF